MNVFLPSFYSYRTLTPPVIPQGIFSKNSKEFLCDLEKGKEVFLEEQFILEEGFIRKFNEITLQPGKMWEVEGYGSCKDVYIDIDGIRVTIDNLDAILFFARRKDKKIPIQLKP